ncbi:putative pheophorbidase [Cytospora mali]|uniref:Pheophorbidase n=1 Tax=Cytospora mali TaxID=578113 RepID=A0A194V4W9_CYTMA|nr:putative pheophorbidase [Valsa mali var. pyri (nom. inval.)]
MAKPIFVLVHGAWHGPRCWDRLTAELDKAGYSSVAPALPSTWVVPPVPDYSQDIDVIRKKVEDLVQEHDIVVVMHSYGGLPGGSALEGLDKQTCSFEGLKGGVIRLIFICAFLVPEGSQCPLTSDSSIPEMRLTVRCAGIVTMRPEDAKFMFYQDMDDETVAELAKDLQPQSIGAFWSTVPTIFAA